MRPSGVRAKPALLQLYRTPHAPVSVQNATRTPQTVRVRQVRGLDLEAQRGALDDAERDPLGCCRT
jgi:hypothetical protein